MDLEQQFDLEHLLFKQRKCRSCGRTKDLLSDFVYQGVFPIIAIFLNSAFTIYS